VPVAAAAFLLLDRLVGEIGCSLLLFFYSLTASHECVLRDTFFFA